MTNGPELAFVGVVAVAWPLYEYLEWPGQLQRMRESARVGRLDMYRGTILRQWALVVVALVLWLMRGRVWDEAALGLTRGWRFWMAGALIALCGALQLRQVRAALRSAAVRAKVRRILGSLESTQPRTGEELGWALALSLTAGVCEELLFRGCVIATLQPWLGWWGAAAVSLVSFSLAHGYQGRRGAVAAALTGAVLTLIVAATGSLIPAMVIHALIDAGSFTLCWVAFRDSDVRPPAAEAA